MGINNLMLLQADLSMVCVRKSPLNETDVETASIKLVPQTSLVKSSDNGIKCLMEPIVKSWKY